MSHPTPPPEESVTAPLAHFVATWRWEDVSDAVRHEAKRSLLNFFAVALAGCKDPTLDIAARMLQRYGAHGAITVAGRGEQTNLLEASALNAMAANVFDFDDTHHPTIIHPTAPVAPAVLALGEERALSGAQALLAFLLGVEVACRLGKAVSPGHYARGWHITSTCGIFGAAAASGRLLALDAERISWALGTASAQASGLVECLGTMAKSMGVGNAARNGLLAALLAQEGFNGPLHPLEGERGFLKVYGEAADLGGIVHGLGEHWEIQCNTYKPYPCGVVLNPVIEACLALSRVAGKGDRAWAYVESIELVGHPLLRQRTDRPGVATGRASQVSAQHAAPVALLRGRAGLEEFSDAAVRDPEVRALGARLVFRDVPSMSIDAAEVLIRFQSGEVLKESVDAARGSLQRPLSDEALEDKLRDLCRYGRSNCDPEPLINAVWNLDRATDVGTLMALAAGRS